MNKIYKVVWSKVRNCYVVASELAKSRAKGSGARGLRRAAVTLGVTAALVGGISGSAWALSVHYINEDILVTNSITVSGDATFGTGSNLLTISGGAITVGTIGGSTTINTTGTIYTTGSITGGTLMIGDVNVGESISALQTSVATKADSATTYTKTEVDTALGAKANSATTLEGYGITDAYSKTETDATFANIDASNLSDDNKTSWATALGTGTIAADSDLLVKGSTVYDYLNGATLALGADAYVNGDYTTAIGASANAGSETNAAPYATAVGSYSQALKDYAVAIGGGESTSRAAKASEKYSIAMGYRATASNQNAIAIGSGTKETNNNNGMAGATASGQDAIAVGKSSSAMNNFSIAIGSSAEANAKYALALGYYSKAGAPGPEDNTNYTIAIGSGTNATAGEAIAIGKGSKVTGKSSIGFGVDNSIGKQSLTTGYDTTTQNVYVIGSNNQIGSLNLDAVNEYVNVFGYNNKATSVKNSIIFGNNNMGITTSGSDTELIRNNENLIIIGNNARIQHGASADEPLSNVIAIGEGTAVKAGSSIAIGDNAQATVAGSVALGSNSKADRAAEQDGQYKPASVDDDEKHVWTSTHSAVSIGYIDSDDPTKNVTRQITGVAAGSADTDAVNVAQLKAVKTHFVGINGVSPNPSDPITSDENYNGAGAVGTNAIAIGRNTRASGDYSTAIGDSASASSSSSIAIGHNSVAKGGESGSAVAIGDNAIIGSDQQGYGYTVAIGDHVTILASNATAVGSNAKVNKPYGTSLGYNSFVGGDKGVALGANTRVTAANSVAIGRSSEANEANVVSLGRSEIKNGNTVTQSEIKRRIIHVADGVGDTDAVNVAQLEATTGINNSHNYYDGSSTAVKVTDAVNAVDKALGKVDEGSNYLTVYDASTSTGTFADNLTALDGAIGTLAADMGNYISSSNADIVTLQIKTQNISETATTDGTTTMKGVLKVVPAGGTTGVAISGAAKTIEAGGVAIDGAANTLIVGGDNGIILNNATTGNTLKVGSITIGDSGTAKTVTGLSNTTWDASSITSGRAATEDQLKSAVSSVSDTLTNAGLKFTANSGGTKTNSLGSTVGVVGTAAQTGHTYSASNITTEIAKDASGNSTITVKLDEDPSFTSVTATDKVQGTSLTDGIAMLTGGALSGVTDLAASGTVTLGSGENTVTISGGNVTATGDISGKNLTASGTVALGSGTNTVTVSGGNVTATGNISSATLKVGGVDVTTLLKTVGAVVSENAGFVTGGTVYSEVRPAAEGNYVKTASTTAANLTALDTAMGKVAAGSNYLTVYDATAATPTGTFADNLKALDTAIGKVTGTNYAVASAGTAATSLAQSIDKIDAGLGAKITADGNYIKASSTNSINANIQALDTALGTLQTNTTAAIGTLADDGNYIKKSDTNNVSQNLSALDKQVYANATDIGTLQTKTQNISATATTAGTTTMEGILNVVDPASGTTGVAISGAAKTITAGGVAIDGAANTLKVGGVTISDNGTAKTVTGLSNKTWDASSITSGQAATEDQLKSAVTSVSGSLTDTGLKFTANSGDPATNKLGSTVSVVGTAAQTGHSYSASNVTTEIAKDESGNSTITVKLDENPLFTSVTATGQVQGGILSDGTATLAGGALTGVKDLAASGTVILGSGTNTVTVSGGNVTATGNISSATLKVGGVDVTTPLTTVGKVESSNAGFVTGGTVYSEVRPAAEGNYVKTASTTADNLTALDTAMGKVATGSNYLTVYDATTTTPTGTFADNLKALDTAIGSMSEFASNNYAKSTSSVAANIKSLDTQVKNNTDNIAALESSTSAAVGTLADDGNYIKKSATNNVSQNLSALDTAIGKTTKGNYIAATDGTAETSLARQVQALDTAAGTFRDKIQNITATSGTTTMEGILNVVPAGGTTGVTISGTAKTITAGGVAIDGTNNTLKVGGDSGITLSNSTSGSVATNTLKVGGVTISDNGTAKTVTGLSNTAWDADNITSGQAATEDQLKSAMTSVSSTLTNAGLKFTANSGGTKTNSLGSTVGVVGAAAQTGHTYSASNITTEISQESGDSTITVKLDENPSFTSVTATGKVQGGSLTDGIATLTGGSLIGVKDLAASGTVTLGSDENTVTISGGAVTATGNISGKDVIASGQLSSKTFMVNGVDVTTPLTTVGKVESSNAGFVTGTTVYSEVRPAADGNYVKTADTTAANLTALDTAMGKVSSTNYAVASTETAATSLAQSIDNIDAGLGAKITADGNYIKASSTNSINANILALDTAIGTLQTNTTAAIGTIDTDGNYILKTNNVSQNLSVLDTQVKSNEDGIAANKAAIGITADGSYVKAAETVGRNLNALDTAIGDMSGFGSQHYAQNTGSVAANLTALDTQVYTNATNIGALQTKTQNISATVGTTTMKGVLNVSDPTSETTGVAISGAAKTITAGGIEIDGANSTLKVGGDSGITLSNATTGNTLKVGGVTISDNGTAKTVTGLSNTTWDADNITSGQAATEDQLKSAVSSVSGALTDTGLKLTANSGGPVTNKLGSTVSVIGSAKQDGHTYSSSNITTEISQESGNSTITVKLDENPSFTSVTATGKVQGTSLTDGTAKLQGGALSGVTDLAASGTVTLGSDENTVTISGGAVTAIGNISGKDVIASGQLSSKTFVVNGVDVTTPLTTVGKVESSNAGFVTGGTVYSEVRPAADGNYVKTASTTAANLKALDSAIGSVAKNGNYIKASSVNNVSQNLSALDTQVKSNADNIKELQSSTTASVGTIDADGNYIKKSDTNNVSQNLIALDTQVKTNADGIAANKAAIGTTSDGSYVKAAETVGRNLNALDTQVKTNTDDIATLKNSISVQEDASGAKTTVIDGNLVIKEEDGTTKDVTAALTEDGEVVKQGEEGSEGFLKGETVYDYLNKGKDGKEVKLATESKQIAVGQGSEASGVESIAIGNETGGQKNTATGRQSIAIGFGNRVTGAHSGAIGDPSYIDADNSYGIGNNNNITASGTAGFVLGNDNTVSGANSYAIGSGNNISGSNTFVMGHNVNASVDNAVVLGDGSTAEENAVSVGSDGNERQIKHVAPGTDANDAVTVGQVDALAQNTAAAINRMDSKVNKVGAGAAALAALHPLDTDDKFTMGLGYGNYRNSHAAAIGMFYRPTDRVMFSMGGTMGNGENMINAGISFALDKGQGFGTSKAAMARKIAAQDEEIKLLKEENSKLEARLAAIEAKLGK